MTSFRESYRRRRWGSTSSIMGFPLGFWEFVSDAVEWEEDGSFSVPASLAVCLTRAELAFLREESRSRRDEEARRQALRRREEDHLYCRWCGSLLDDYGNQVCLECEFWDEDAHCYWCRRSLGPYELQTGNYCAECERWYEHAHCYWCWDWAEFWYPGWPVFHLPLCGRCSRRHLDGMGPPWYPNLLQRRELHVRWLFEAQTRGSRYALPREVCDVVAGFLAELWRP